MAGSACDRRDNNDPPAILLVDLGTETAERTGLAGSDRSKEGLGGRFDIICEPKVSRAEKGERDERVAEGCVDASRFRR